MNYTANLTEERDELNASLEEAKKALQREMATRIALESKGQMQQGRKVRLSLTAHLPWLQQFPGQELACIHGDTWFIFGVSNGFCTETGSSQDG